MQLTPLLVLLFFVINPSSCFQETAPATVAVLTAEIVFKSVADCQHLVVAKKHMPHYFHVFLKLTRIYPSEHFVLFLQNLSTVKRNHFTTKYQEMCVIFWFLAPSTARGRGILGPLYHNGDLVSFHRDRDILIHLYPSGLRFPAGNEHSSPENNCLNPANIFIMEYATYDGQGEAFVKTAYQLKIRCRFMLSCIEDAVLGSTGVRTYPELLQELKNQRKDFNFWPIMLFSPKLAAKRVNLNHFRAKTLRTWQESPAGYNDLLIFFLGLAEDLNFTLYSLSRWLTRRFAVSEWVHQPLQLS